MSNGSGGSGSDGAAVRFNQNVIEVLRKQVSVATASDAIPVSMDKKSEGCLSWSTVNHHHLREL